jgi:hypothetical protein
MKHALAPTREGSVGKVVVESGRVMGVEAGIDPVVSQSLNQAVGKRLKWYKGEDTGDPMVQNQAIQAALNPIKLSVRAVKEVVVLGPPLGDKKLFYIECFKK